MRTYSKKIHLGCFDQILPGWLNTDITPHIFLSRIPGLPYLLYKVGVLPKFRYTQHVRGIFRSVSYLNVTKRFPFPNEIFEYVYCSHLLEHLFPQQAVYCLKEIHRVLKQGGLVRISLPDLDKIVDSYDPKFPEAFLATFFESKQKYRKNRHHWHYNKISLHSKLKKTGFKKIYSCDFRKGCCTDCDIIDNRPGSLFIEAVK